MRQVAVVILVVGSWLFAGCSSDASSGAESAMAKLGEACSSTVKCTGGTCAGAGVCTTTCDLHSDCGCPTGTTNGDIKAGRCGLSCTDGECVKVCASSVDCAGNTSCTLTEAFRVCE
jgi:hypothetical protein